jgi:hypothetical protein
MVLKVQNINLEPALKPDPASQALAMQTTVELPSSEPVTSKIAVLPPADPTQLPPRSQMYIESYERELSVYENRIDEYNRAVDLFNARQGPDPGDFEAQPPRFEQDVYSGFLLSEFERDLAGQKAQFDLARKAEEEKYAEQRTQLEREQALLAEENAKAQVAAEAAAKASEEQATQSRAELERRRGQFREETETLQRNTGAQRAGFVRARRLRNRPLLGL